MSVAVLLLALLLLLLLLMLLWVLLRAFFELPAQVFGEAGGDDAWVRSGAT